jgi:hypothetical protein
MSVVVTMPTRLVTVVTIIVTSCLQLVNSFLSMVLKVASRYDRFPTIHIHSPIPSFKIESIFSISKINLDTVSNFGGINSEAVRLLSYCSGICLFRVFESRVYQLIRLKGRPAVLLAILSIMSCGAQTKQRRACSIASRLWYDTEWGANDEQCRRYN